MSTNPLSWSRTVLNDPRAWKFTAAVFIGFSLGAVLKGEPLHVPGFGPAPLLPVAALGLLLGGVLYLNAPKGGCGCGSDCDC